MTRDFDFLVTALYSAGRGFGPVVAPKGANRAVHRRFERASAPTWQAFDHEQ
jgi:hypothetical protein